MALHCKKNTSLQYERARRMKIITFKEKKTCLYLKGKGDREKERERERE